ncbi:MAG TPA: SpoIIE family protein phosphatase [Clostridiales bacterium]|nr:SpoIIE family protein phosphatase [Clostridiales bacterium]
MERILQRVKVFFSAREELKAGVKTTLLWAALGFGAAFFKVGNGYTPFAAALVGALPFIGGLSAGIGAIVAGLIMLPDIQGGIVLMSAGLALAARMFFRQKSRFWSISMAALAALAASVLLKYLPDKTVFTLLGAIFEGLLTLGVCFLVSPLNFTAAFSDRASGLAAFVILFAVCAAPGSIGFGGLALGRIIAVAAFLLLIRDASPLYAAAIGGVGGFILTCTSKTLMVLSPALALAAYAFCAFRRSAYGRSFLFFGVSSVVLIACSGAYDALVCLYEVGIAALVSASVPIKLYEKLKREKSRPPVRESPESRRLFALSDAMREVFCDLREANTRLSALKAPHVTPETVAREICLTCRRKNLCWNLSYAQTDRALRTAIRQGGDLSFCIKGEQVHKMIEAGDTGGENLSARQNPCEHFEMMSDLLLAAAQNADFSGEDEYLKSALSGLLRRLRLDVVTQSALSNGKSLRLRIVCVNAPSASDLQQISALVEKHTGKKLDKTRIERAAGGYEITAESAPAVTVDFALAQRSADGVCSGDICRIIPERGLFILSDGMGTGPRAALDGHMAISVFEKLYCAGSGIDIALCCANSALAARTDNEALATFDALLIDDSTGEAEFIKAGAYLSYVLRDGSVSKIEGNTLPIGILGDPQVFRRKVRLQKGDVIVMTSDGIIDEELPAARLRDKKERSLKAFCEGLAEEAKDRSADKKDDITVLAIEVS